MALTETTLGEVTPDCKMPKDAEPVWRNLAIILRHRVRTVFWGASAVGGCEVAFVQAAVGGAAATAGLLTKRSGAA